MVNHSIIIPFRDKFELMNIAYESVPDRDDIQVILIYNGKEPFPPEMIPSKSKAETVFLQSDPTKGAGHARNVGLKSAKGKYVHFLDADDFFTPEAFLAFDKYLGSGCDVIYFKPTSIFLNNGKPSTRHQYYSNLVDEYNETSKEDRIRYRWEGPVCKMISLSFISEHNITFEEVRVSNDARFSLHVGHYAGKIAADPTTVYVITEAEAGQSLVKTRSAENMFIRYQVQIRNNHFLSEVGHFDQHVRLLGAIRVALIEFGVREFCKYIVYAAKNKAWIF